MGTITHTSLFRTYTYEVVEEVPFGYRVWNIGKNMVEGYLPFCRLSSQKPFPGGRSIETDTLKAVKCDGAQVILDAAGLIDDLSVENAEKFIKKYKETKNSWKQHCIEKLVAALPYIRKIKGL